MHAGPRATREKWIALVPGAFVMDAGWILGVTQQTHSAPQPAPPAPYAPHCSHSSHTNIQYPSPENKPGQSKMGAKRKEMTSRLNLKRNYIHKIRLLQFATKSLLK